jgi:hypothetical protein
MIVGLAPQDPGFRALFFSQQDPDFEDRGSAAFCHPIVYKFSLVLIIAFDLVFGVAAAIWVGAIVAGEMDLLGPFPDTNPLGENVSK